MQINQALKLSFLLPSVYAQLHGAAKTAGLLYFGTETESVSFGDAAYQAALKGNDDFGQITPGNSMKWDAIQPAPNTFTFTAGDAIADLAATNNQLLRCHNLVWHEQLPDWVSGGNWTAASLTQVLQNHITTEVTHYKGKCYAWDVVNEALNDNGTFGNDVFFNVLGSDYIKIAFQAAAAADPAAKLYYNDFGTEFPGVKSTAAQGIVKMLKDANIKIDGVGFQGHFTVGGTPSVATQVTNMEAFTALGVEVAITELDIRMTLPQTDAMLAQQKTDYQTTAAACLATKNCVGVTVWDFDDKYSWVPSTFPGTGSADIMTANVTKKPAYFGVLQAFTGTAANSTTTMPSMPNMTVTAPSLRASSSGASALDKPGMILGMLLSLIFAMFIVS
ncbi:glycoside hydrolase [Mollisia scopiformis]|uniref:Beta-xylanase n=1 Tax=Mollisia scopiformis TaxID=149040 RepID=A0A194X7F1_MOLSC|nr:glycoside hydrolase [Mollisia scopiformis]KUJ16103.1 glycoside hydrolase [Mollisia scopiformis]